MEARMQDVQAQQAELADARTAMMEEMAWEIELEEDELRQIDLQQEFRVFLRINLAESWNLLNPAYRLYHIDDCESLAALANIKMPELSDARLAAEIAYAESVGDREWEEAPEEDDD